MRESQIIDELGKAPASAADAQLPKLSGQEEQENNSSQPVSVRENPLDDIEKLPGSISKKAASDAYCENPDKSETDPGEPIPGKELSDKEITDHTAALWRYLPVPENEPEPAPEYKTYSAALPGARVVGARVRGKKHKHEGSNCDDWFEVGNADDITFIAVSDGAGSKKFSRIGARESCKSAIGFLTTQISSVLADKPSLREDLKNDITDMKCRDACGIIAGFVQRAVMKAWEAVEAAFYSRTTDAVFADVLKRDLTLSDLSGTLLVSAIIPIRKEAKEYLIVSCQIGDGMIAAINSAGPFPSSVKLLAVPDSGDYSGETEFLTSPKMKKLEELQKRTKLSIGAVDTLLMMSDGVADDYFPNETQIRRLYYDLIANGIIGRRLSLSDLDQKQLSLFKRIPDPISYPWVNDKTVTVPIHYTNRICDSMGVTFEELWDQREILTLASLELRDRETLTNDGERLSLWLDNYYERGSFDDRTLVIAEL